MSAPTAPRLEIHPWAQSSTLQFAWAPPLIGAVSSYNLICSSISFSQSYNPSTFLTKVNGLTNNQEYTFQLSASNINGTSAYAKFMIAEPGAPSQGATNVVVSTVNSTIALINWSYSTNVNECKARYFAISAIPSTLGQSTYVYIAYQNQSSFQMQPLNPAETYTFLVQAVTDVSWAFPYIYSFSPPLTMNP